MGLYMFALWDFEILKLIETPKQPNPKKYFVDSVSSWDFQQNEKREMN